MDPYLALAWCFIVFVALLVIGLPWLWWLYIRSLVFAALLLTCPGTAFAQAGSGKSPVNARTNSYGGWQCNRGYRRDGEACVAITVPLNAHLDRYGRGWECDRGHRKDGEVCVAFNIPSNAYLHASGDRWSCDRGYRRANEACVAIKVPANAYLSDTTYGRGWECDRGFRQVDTVCVTIDVPKNAFLQVSGDRWKCERGFRPNGDLCVPVEIPLNGYLHASGDDWKLNEATRELPHRAWPSRCQRLPTSTYREMTGIAIRATPSKWTRAPCGHETL